MDRVFSQRPPPRTFKPSDVFGEDGNLRMSVFSRAFAHVNPTSTPGFPFLKVASNSMLNPMDVYTAVNDLIKKWTLFSDFTLDARELFLRGYAPPAHVFIKSEPTGESKIARLIYGVSVILNVIARIIFGDYLTSIATTWYTASHKVGLDFNTSSGLDKLRSFTRTLAASQKKLGCQLVSDDIQGWEYQCREWMHKAWHDSYLKSAKATMFHKHLQSVYAHIERNTLIMLSDGELYRLPFFIRLSGVVTTHLQNSDERSALADTDLCFEFNVVPEKLPLITSMTNGDDCVRLKGPRNDISTGLGFVHTDVREEDLDGVFNFCSQEFFTSEPGLLRRPGSLAKSVYNLISRKDVDDGFHAIMLYIMTHEKFRDVQKLVSMARTPAC